VRVKSAGSRPADATAARTLSAARRNWSAVPPHRFHPSARLGGQPDGRRRRPRDPDRVGPRPQGLDGGLEPAQAVRPPVSGAAVGGAERPTTGSPGRTPKAVSSAGSRRRRPPRPAMDRPGRCGRGCRRRPRSMAGGRRVARATRVPTRSRPGGGGDAESLAETPPSASSPATGRRPLGAPHRRPETGGRYRLGRSRPPSRPWGRALPVLDRGTTPAAVPAGRQPGRRVEPVGRHGRPVSPLPPTGFVPRSRPPGATRRTSPSPWGGLAVLGANPGRGRGQVGPPRREPARDRAGKPRPTWPTRSPPTPRPAPPGSFLGPVDSSRPVQRRRPRRRPAPSPAGRNEASR